MKAFVVRTRTADSAYGPWYHVWGIFVPEKKLLIRHWSHNFRGYITIYPDLEGRALQRIEGDKVRAIEVSEEFVQKVIEYKKMHDYLDQLASDLINR